MSMSMCHVCKVPDAGLSLARTRLPACLCSCAEVLGSELCGVTDRRQL